MVKCPGKKRRITSGAVTRARKITDNASFRTITLDEEKGIKALVGCRKGHYDEKKCEVGTRVLSYLFAKDKGWNMSEATAWFDKNKK